MERLTGWNKGNAYYIECCARDVGDRPGAEQCDNGCAFCDENIKQCELLARYEDTGLTPEEILRLKKLDTPKEPEWEYDDECVCPNCGETIEVYDVTRMCRCPECGQRWKWREELKEMEQLPRDESAGLDPETVKKSKPDWKERVLNTFLGGGGRKMELTEFILKRERMLNSFGRTGGKCDGVLCRKCPLNEGSICALHTLGDAQKAEKIVQKWNEEHPPITNRMKFEEVFGVRIPACCATLAFNNDTINWDEEYKNPETVKKGEDNGI